MISLRCLFGHDWEAGRIASVDARVALGPYRCKRLPSLRNRRCFRCGKLDRAADRIEAEHLQRKRMRDGL